jgi:hypothetical protein
VLKIDLEEIAWNVDMNMPVPDPADVNFVEYSLGVTTIPILEKSSL